MTRIRCTVHSLCQEAEVPGEEVWRVLLFDGAGERYVLRLAQQRGRGAPHVVGAVLELDRRLVCREQEDVA